VRVFTIALIFALTRKELTNVIAIMVSSLVLINLIVTIKMSASTRHALMDIARILLDHSNVYVREDMNLLMMESLVWIETSASMDHMSAVIIV
jgi:hypothetical protein